MLTSASVILSIKVKRTATHCNSLQAGSTTSVYSSSFSEATEDTRRDVVAETNKQRQRGGKKGQVERREEDTKEGGKNISRGYQIKLFYQARIILILLLYHYYH